ncbi:hypothetical protein CEXT_148991 [Caerostris extrusa]|uniref:Uncharacterized protein n=1 Tax=Caerostris extrusa TaxID=172846 RepID=A0AAV4Y4U9_CAEEX|nr:hypothetical protein CEXT_148991 [Caerostris extrusa]
MPTHTLLALISPDHSTTGRREKKNQTKKGGHVTERLRTGSRFGLQLEPSTNYAGVQHTGYYSRKLNVVDAQHQHGSFKTEFLVGQPLP